MTLLYYKYQFLLTHQKEFIRVILPPLSSSSPCRLLLFSHPFQHSSTLIPPSSFSPLLSLPPLSLLFSPSLNFSPLSLPPYSPPKIPLPTLLLAYSLPPLSQLSCPSLPMPCDLSNLPTLLLISPPSSLCFYSPAALSPSFLPMSTQYSRHNHNFRCLPSKDLNNTRQQGIKCCLDNKDPRC